MLAYIGLYWFNTGLFIDFPPLTVVNLFNCFILLRKIQYTFNGTMKVRSLNIREILATNVQKTLEVDIETTKAKARASVPIGTSTGKYEVKYLPTEDAVRKFMLIRRHFATEPLDSQEDADTLIHIIDKT